MLSIGHSTIKWAASDGNDAMHWNRHISIALCVLGYHVIWRVQTPRHPIGQLMGAVD